jgi:aldose 1-epimerase
MNLLLVLQKVSLRANRPMHSRHQPRRANSARVLAACLALIVVAVTGCQPGVETAPAAPAQDEDTAAEPAAAATATAATQESSDMPKTADSRPTPDFKMILKQSTFGKLPDGKEVTLYTFANASGLTVKMIDYGAIVVAVETSDKNGDRANINLGFDSLEGYLERHPYFGATVGRYANRIAGGRFTLDGKEFTLATNNGANHLHGGLNGLDRALWAAEEVRTVDSVGVNFIYESPDGEEGYPGNLRVVAGYVLNNNDELVITLTATTDKSTPVNLTNHCYWNLSGAGSGTILDHELVINAEKYLPVNEGLIPTGELADVAGTPFDFREPHKIGERIGELTNDPQGYDHCYVLRPGEAPLRLAAWVRDRKSGRVMEIHTTQPAVQFYSGNFLDGTPASGNFPQYGGLCLETQHYPDSPNQPAFPNTILRPGETYKHVTVHKFSVQ